MLSNYDLLLRYESEGLNFEDTITLFTEILETGAYMWLQGHYGRQLEALINEGYISND